jgi:hypothetical protein
MNRTRFSAVVTVPCLAAALLVGAVLAAPRTAHAQSFFTDFNAVANGQNAPGFGNDSGTFAVSNPTGSAGSYLSNRGATFNFSTVTAPGLTSLTDTALSFDLIDAADSGAVLRSDANVNNGVVAIVRPSAGDFYLIRRIGGSFSGAQLATTSLAGVVSTGDDLRMTFSAVGNTFTATLASLSAPSTVLRTISYTFTAADNVPAAGRAGLYQYGNTSLSSTFDNVSVTSASAATVPEASTLLLVGPAALSATLLAVRRRIASL